MGVRGEIGTVTKQINTSGVEYTWRTKKEGVGNHCNPLKKAPKRPKGGRVSPNMDAVSLRTDQQISADI